MKNLKLLIMDMGLEDIYYSDIAGDPIIRLELGKMGIEKIATLHNYRNKVTYAHSALKIILMGCIHYGINTAEVVKLFIKDELLIPTLLQMIREGYRYEDAMARVLLTFEYIEYITGCGILCNAIKKDVSFYKETINKGQEYILLTLLRDISEHDYDARTAYFMYQDTLRTANYKDLAEKVFNVRKEFSDIIL